MSQIEELTMVAYGGGSGNVNYLGPCRNEGNEIQFRVVAVTRLRSNRDCDGLFGAVRDLWRDREAPQRQNQLLILFSNLKHPKIQTTSDASAASQNCIESIKASSFTISKFYFQF
ncbi:hypothetical protein RIF29_35428 [Crotalaria pallida]|uniref:Uncharacterized protein n=1 Tax=Crotalaria pallida TaxID=3830 RepID=A0AAN9E9W7_CROPI